MGDYNIGDVWWVDFPFQDGSDSKRRPAVVVDDDTIAVFTMYVTSKNKENPYSIEICDWEQAGLDRPSWVRIDRIIRIEERNLFAKIGSLSESDLTKCMQLIKELQSGTNHEFTLLAIQNPSGEYLQVYDERWNCWLFPYIRSNDENKSNADQFVSKLLGSDTVTQYVSVTKHCKYSESDRVYKIYNHKLYRVQLDEVPEIMQTSEFEIDGTRYKWFSITSLESDESIMEKNEDVIAFVKAKCI